MIEIILLVLTTGAAVYFFYRAYTIAGVVADTEDYIKELENMNTYMYTQIKESVEKMQEIDYKGSFEADDEIGVVFQSIKEAVDEINEITEQEL